MEDNTTTVMGKEILQHKGRPDVQCVVKPYDFKRPDKFSHGQIRTFQMLHEGIGRRLAPMLGAHLDAPVELKEVFVDQLNFAESVELTSEPGRFLVLSAPPLPGNLLLELSPSLAAELVDSACGKSGPTREELGVLTATETVILRHLSEEMLSLLDQHWMPIESVRHTLESVESSRQHVLIVPPTAMVIYVALTFTEGKRDHTVRVVLPDLALEPVAARFSPEYWYSQVRKTDNPSTGTVLAGARIDMTLELAGAEVAVAELPDLLKGRPVKLPDLADGRLEICAGGQSVAAVTVDPDNLVQGNVSFRKMVITDRTGLPTWLLPPRGEDGRLQTLARGSSSSRGGEALDPVHGELAEIRAMIADLAGSVSELAGVASEPPSASAAGRTGRSIPPGRARAILLTLKDDSPQVIALCLSMLPPETAAAVLPGLPETMQADVVAAIAGLEPVDEALQERLMRHLARSVQQQQTLGQIGGIERTVGILNLVPRSVEKSVMTRFENDDPSLFEALAQRMFVFEDMTIVDSGAIQALAEAVGESTLALASKGAPPEVISHIAGALHDDVADSYQTQLSALGRVRRHDVERAQQSVIEELKALEQSGTVVVMRRDEVVE